MVIALIPNPKIEVPVKNVLARLGYRDRLPTAAIRQQVEFIVKEADTYISPIAFYEFIGISGVSSQSVTLDGSKSLNSEKVSNVLSNCERVAVFAVTIGSRLEQKIATCTEAGETFEAFTLDAYGSAAAEVLADHLSQHVKNIVQVDGKKTTDRYSPGYCDWSLDEQDTIFGVLKCDEMTIKLNNSKMMIPRKSISGIIGVTDAGNRIVSPCPRCELKDTCPHRRHPK